MQKIKFFSILSFISVLLIFTACGGNSSSNVSSKNTTTKSIEGYLIDAPVANMNYHCGDIKSKTEKDGKFKCNKLPIVFMIGDIEVGTLHKITSDFKVYPQDLAGQNRDDFNNSKVLKIASFLQSLDNDGDISDTITISDNIHIDGSYKLDEMSQEEVTQLLEDSGITPVTPKDAEKHLREHTEVLAPRPTPSLRATPTPTASPIETSTLISSLIAIPTPTASPRVTPTPIANPIPTASPTPTATPTSTPSPTSTPIPTPSPTSTPIPDTIPPAKNSTINSLKTDDATPPLSGNLPSGENDTNSTNYTVKIKIDNDYYNATNEKNGTWSIADNIISPLSLGYHDVNITVTDEANNSSSTFLPKKIEINNIGFIIDSAIEGIKYVSGALSGYTDKDGLFKYDKGAGVTFYIGDESTGISLGTAIEKTDPYNAQRRIITLFDLAGTQDENNSKVINMGKLLQSLDVDKDVSNGITIDEKSKESIALLGLKNKINFDVDIDTFNNSADIYNLFNDLADHFGEHRGLIATDDAKAHLVAVRDNKLPTKHYNIAKVSGDKEKVEILTGVFRSINGVVEGLAYRSGNQFGLTNEKGEFKYEEGKKVKFSIYQLELGITDGKEIITPADLALSTSFNNPKTRNIIRLLKAFDAIANDNKITIDKAVREALEKYRSQIDINLPDGKANAELGIPKGEDEFGAQFEDFEMGKDILDEIDRLRRGV